MVKISQEEILKVIQDALNPSGERVTVNSAMEDIEEWDSLGHLGILAALDKLFNGKANDIRGLGNAKSVQEILQLLKDNKLI